MSNERVNLFLSFGKLFESRWHVLGATLLSLFALFAFCRKLTILAVLVIICTDLFLALMLWCAAWMSAEHKDTWPGLPSRRSAVAVLFLLFVSLVLACAALYQESDSAPSAIQALYMSFVNLASFAYSSSLNEPNKAIQSTQLASGILLLLCAFPILLSRLSELDRKG